MKLNSLKYLCIFVLLPIFLISCSSRDEIVHERFAKASEGEGDVVIGVVWPESKLKSDFKNGIEMALEEVNREGLMGGRKMKLIFRDNEGDLDINRSIVQNFANNTDMVAVFGHFYSSFALPSSVTYQESGLLFLTPASLLFELSLHGFETFFRSIPNTIAVGSKCASYSYKLGFNNPIVLWERSQYGKTMYNIYKSSLAKLGIDMSYSFSYLSLEDDYRDIIAQMKRMEFDMIFLAVSSSDAPFLIRKVRENKIDVPFFGINLVQEVINERVGEEYAHDIYTISNFDPESTYPPTVEFVRNFNQRFDHAPDVWGAYGYDGIKLFAHLINTYETTHPKILATNLRYLENWEGVTGNHTFTPRGEVRSKPLYLEEFINNEFVQIGVDTLQIIDLYRVYHNILQLEIDRGYLKVIKNGDINVVLLPDISIFTGTDYEVSDKGRRILDILVEELNNHPEYKIQIEGYADITFISDIAKTESEIMLDLSLRKSAQVAKELYKLGIMKSRIQVIGRGYAGQSEYATEIRGKKAFDNRVELVLIPPARPEALPASEATAAAMTDTEQ
ncbi:MAG: ABC transporter substrate-binding protein [Candidatus Electryoneaceae bacterium]|nr:ABC transporter substrate-binding protein [Candidatus Electryoneaceae bacterium]